MTASTKTIAVTFLLALGLSSTSFAQQVYASNSVKSPGANTTMIMDENSSTKTVDPADPAIVTRFSALFPNATNLRWTSSADNILVSFVINDRKGSASFTAKAELNYVITDCGMEQLPAAFSKSIKKDYASWHLFNAKEITAYGNVAYQAILENSKGYITLKYTAEGVEEIQQVKKQ
ncbi:MAG: hypothetical protein ABIR78_05495 [Ferruginibacter sp.]